MAQLPHMTILEEFTLLALDDRAGDFWPVPRSALDCATACAILMDLMCLRRVDCDAYHVFVVDHKPTNDEILDPILAALAIDPVKSTRAIIDELSFLSDEAEELRDRVLQRLIERGILEDKQRKILWMFGSHHYPVLDDHPFRLIKLRVLNVIFGEDIPDPRDIALVSLLQAAGLLRYLINAREMARALPRITKVAQMDILGKAAADVIAEVETSIAMASGLR